MDQVLGMKMPPNKQWFCRLQMYNFFSSFLCSCYLLITMTFERFYSIIRPHKAASFNTVKRARIIIVCIYITCFSYSIPFLFLAGNIEEHCIPNVAVSNNIYGQLYYWLTEIVIFIFPFSSLLTMNSVIIHTLRNRSKKAISGSTGLDENESQNLKIKQTEKQIITTLLLITFVFLILNIPVRTLVYFLNFSSGDSPFYYASLHLIYQIGGKCFYTNHGINFFLYVISGQKFRTDLKNLFVSQIRKMNKNTNTRNSAG